MNARLISIGLLGTVIGIQPLAAQEAPLPNQSQGAAEAAVTSPSRLAAGLRAYPDNVVDALLTLADEPGLIRRLAEQPELLDNPERIEPPLTDTLKAALVELRAEPRIIAMAADHPAELEQLRMLHAVAPEGLKLRLGQLRADYERWVLSAAAAWQRALEQDPVALGEYRELLTRLCNEERAADGEFPYVYVISREYYAACVPNDLFVSFLARQAGFVALKQLIDPWWAAYAPERIDEAAQGRLMVADSISLGAKPGQTRAAMWRPAEAGVADSIGMVPVIMQPLADQPLEARQEYALAEHARLWSAPLAPLPAPRAREVAEVIEIEQEPVAEPVVEVVEWPPMRQVAVRAARRGRAGSGGRSWYGGSGYSVGGVTLGYGGYGRSYYGGYGGVRYYGGFGWPYTANELDRLSTLGDISPGRYGSGYVIYDGGGRTTYVERSGVRVHDGPTTYYYRSPTTRVRHTRTTVGVRRHYRSATRQISRGTRGYATYGGRISGTPRRSQNVTPRVYRSTVPRRFRSGGGTIGLRRPSTIGTRGPTTIGRRPSGYQRSNGIRRGVRTIHRSNPGVRTRSDRQPDPRRRR